MPARLQTLGHLRLLDEAGEEIAFPEKGLLMLCHLQARGLTEQSRADLAMFLWEDPTPGGGLANLRQTISRIVRRQTEIGRTYLTFSTSSVHLGPDPVTSDLSTVTDTADLAVLAAALTDDFLKHIKSDGKALRNWIGLQRAAHRGRLRRALLDAARGGEKADRQAMSTTALRLLETDPHDDAVRAILAGFSADTGRQMLPVFAEPRAMAVNAVPYPDASEDRQSLPPRIVLLPPVTTFASRPAARFSEALIEDVTIGLCALRSVSIIAPHTAAQISMQADKATTYERHAISYILETKLRDEGDGHTLFAQLIFFGSDEVIWADRFPLTAEGLLRSRQMISHQIAGAITTQIELNELTRNGYECDPGTYMSFLTGQSLLKKLDLRDVRRARKNFREALQANSRFAPALGGLARSFFLEWLVTARGDQDLLRQAEAHAQEAIQADERLPSGYRELGVVKLYARQFDESEAYLSRAEELSPHYANVIASHADTLVQASRPGDGLKKIEHAIDLNPLPPDEYFWTAAGASYSLGLYEQALTHIARMKDRTPADRLSAASWGMLGNTRKARQFIRRTYDIHPDFDLNTWMEIVPFREEWQRKHYYEGLKRAGF
jgi:DNA-binding SARP family transcriptional activator/TolB-like protein